MSDDHQAFRVIKGRRWRISDPNIPSALRQQLVNELMSARRAVATANRTDSDTDRRDARARVLAAKVALGERGPHWWEPMSDGDIEVRAEATLFALLNHRSMGSSLCPSEVARAIGAGQWRAYLPLVRDIVQRQTELARLTVMQKGEVVDCDAKGPVRIARGPEFSSYFQRSGKTDQEL